MIRYLILFVLTAILSTTVGCSSVENDWQSAKQTNTSEVYKDFLEKHMDSPFADSAKIAIENLIWQRVQKENTIEGYIIGYVKAYPDGRYVESAREAIWTIRWPPVEITTANSVTICSNGGCVISGEIMYPLSGFFGGQKRDPEPGGPNRVIIWRDFSSDEAITASKLDLRSGVAYLRTDSGEYKVIRKIDLKKSDDELCAEFGITNKK
jgi:hypothetical protein